MTPDDTTPTDDATSGRRFPRWLTWGLVAIGAAIVLLFGAILIYVNFINDPEEALTEDDLVAALADDTTVPEDDPVTTSPDETTVPTAAPATTEPSATTAPAAASTEPPASTVPDADAPAGSDVWIVTDASELGYRVKEILFGIDTEGVGRTNQITGGLTIEGATVTTAEFVVDVASIESDDGRRDNQFRGRIMSTDEFPEASFLLTEPIELGTEAVEGATVETSATGELTLRGVTNPVTFDLSARLENGRIGVLGNIPVVFEDYGIANPSTGGITTEDNGLLEFVLVFEPATT